MELLEAQGITPAPGLELSQLLNLTNKVVCETPVQDEPSEIPSTAITTGQKCAKKNHHPAPQAKRNVFSNSSAHPNQSNNVSYISENHLTSTLQSLANSVQAIHTRLQSLENAQASSSLAMLTASQIPLFHTLVPAPAPQTSTSTASAPVMPQHSLASAVDAPRLGCMLLLVQT